MNMSGGGGYKREDQGPGGSPQEGGSFWTSYSDMLLGLSVIFLVLFFLAILRTGVEQSRTQKAKEETQTLLAGRVPPEIREKNREKEDLLRNSIDELAKRRQALDQSALEISRTTELLKEQSQAVHEILKEQEQKTATLSLLSEKADQLEGTLQLTEASRSELEKRLAERDLTLETLQQDLGTLARTRQELTSQLSQAKTELDLRETELQKLETTLNEKSLALTHLEESLNQERKTLEQTRINLDREHQNALKLHSQVIETEETKNSYVRDTDQLRTDKLQLAEKVAELQTENAALRARFGGIDRSFSALEDENKTLGYQKTQIQGELQKTQSALLDLEEQNTGLQKALTSSRVREEIQSKKLSHCEQQASLTASTRSPGFRSLGEQLAQARADLEALTKKRRAIASDLDSSLRNHGIAARVHPENGILTFEMDEAFRFQNGSAELTHTAKEKLRRIIPIYAERVFRSAKGQGKTELKRVTITGYASPRFLKTYLPPSDKTSDGAQYNQKLSENRAQQIADFLFGEEIGNYPYKTELQQAVTVSGKGHAQPLRAPAGEKAVEPCGPYDCTRSRRVELNFILEGETLE